MPVFREYTAKGKLTPSDLGFTAMETAARRQQSFTADQQAAIEKSAKAVGQAWEGSLKFGLDEIELAQQQADKGGGGVKVAGSKGSSRTLLGTGAGGDTNWNARANASNAAADATSKLAQLARDKNNQVAPPLDPVAAAKAAKISPGAIGPGAFPPDPNADPSSGVSVARGNQKAGQPQVTQGTGNPYSMAQNPQGLLGPKDVDIAHLRELGMDPGKQIIASPLGAPGSVTGTAKEAGYEIGQGTGLSPDFGPGESPQVSERTPMTTGETNFNREQGGPKSGAKTWSDIVNSINPFSSDASKPVPVVTGYDKKGNPVHDPNISGYDAAGKPYYTFPDKNPGDISSMPTGNDTPDATPLVPDTPVDTSPALAPSAVDNWNPG